MLCAIEYLKKLHLSLSLLPVCVRTKPGKRQNAEDTPDPT